MIITMCMHLLWPSQSNLVAQGRFQRLSTVWHFVFLVSSVPDFSQVDILFGVLAWWAGHVCHYGEEAWYSDVDMDAA